MNSTRGSWRFQFSLSALFALLTAVGLYLGCQASAVRQRKALCRWVEENGGSIHYVSDSTVPRGRHFICSDYFDGQRIDFFVGLTDWDDCRYTELARLFPQASVYRLAPFQIYGGPGSYQRYEAFKNPRGEALIVPHNSSPKRGDKKGEKGS